MLLHVLLGPNWQIALTIAHAITSHSHTSKSTDYCPNLYSEVCDNYQSISNTDDVQVQPKSNDCLSLRAVALQIKHLEIEA